MKSALFVDAWRCCGVCRSGGLVYEDCVCGVYVVCVVVASVSVSVIYQC